MKIKSITNVNGFFDAVAQCKGKVELTTVNGDRLNLKSHLCRLFALAEMFDNPQIGEITLICSDAEDIGRLMNFLVRN